MQRTYRIAAWMTGGLTCLALSGTIPANAQDADSKVDRITETENVPNEARKAPAKTQVLPPGRRIPKAEESRRARDDGTNGTRQQQPDAGRRQPQQPPRRPDAANHRDASPRRNTLEADRRPGTNRRDMQIAPRPLGIELDGQAERLSVRDVNPESAAARIGLRSGDEVVSLGGQQIASEQDFNAALQGQLRASRRSRNFQIPVVVRRNGQLQTYYWTNVALAMAGYGPMLNRYGYYVPPRYTTGYRGPLGAPSVPNNSSGAYLGVELDRQYPDAAIVSRVYDGTPAEQAGLQAGDRIWALNNQRIESIDELIYSIAQMEPGQRIEISFDRPHSTEIVLGERGQPAPPRSATNDVIQPQTLPAEAPGPIGESPLEESAPTENAPTATSNNDSP